MKDRRLVHRLSRADPDALRQIYNRHKDDLLTVAMALLGAPESFAKLCRRYRGALVAPADSILPDHQLVPLLREIWSSYRQLLCAYGRKIKSDYDLACFYH